MRRQRRQEKARPLVDDLRAAIDDASRRLSPKSAIAEALAYGRKRWIALTRYLDDGLAEIDNNVAERAAAIYSVIETAKLNGIKPQANIADIIAKIPDGWPAARWDELMPWNWASGQQPLIAEAA
jgi:transposase